jgi:hypothetical protein
VASTAAKQGLALSAPQKSLVAKHRQGAVDMRELSALIRKLAQGA